MKVIINVNPLVVHGGSQNKEKLSVQGKISRVETGHKANKPTNFDI